MAIPKPIRPEDLAKQYSGRWIICCELNWDGTHGDWEAVSCRSAPGARLTTIKARSIEALAEQLAKTEV